MARDSKKSKVYRADWQIADDAKHLRTVEEMQEFADLVTGSAWWKGKTGSNIHVDVSIGNSQHVSSTNPYHKRITMSASPVHHNCFIILHELAHIFVLEMAKATNPRTPGQFSYSNQCMLEASYKWQPDSAWQWSEQEWDHFLWGKSAGGASHDRRFVKSLIWLVKAFIPKLYQPYMETLKETGAKWNDERRISPDRRIALQSQASGLAYSTRNRPASR